MSTPLIIATFIGVFLLIILIGYAVARSATGNSIPGPSLTADDEDHFEVLGRRVVCSHCGKKKFKAREILLNTWLLSLLRLDWLDPGSTVLTCQQCGKLTWFSQTKSED
jgi:hypothetical protein